ncbi:MAG: P1 family peptidase [Firmicutes bacterium]|nr:P1 family peptidase [Bacillota bacterium]
MEARPRVRDIGLVLGELPTGPHNAITDVAGVRVGHATVSFGSGPLQPGRGPARTGVTAIIPQEGNCFLRKLEAAAYVINGFGKSIGLPQLQELGQLETPILLTSTLNAPKVADALISYMLLQSKDIGITTSTVNVVVGECNDGHLNDGQGRHVQEEHVWQALQSASGGPVAEGAGGAGTGRVAFGFKGGIGTASRVLTAEMGGFTVGALVLSNFGSRRHLTIAGVPVGRELAEYKEEKPNDGSIMIIIATDAPLKSRQLLRLAKRAPFGLARTGGIASNGSGDFAIAFSTTLPQPHSSQPGERQDGGLLENGQLMTQLFQATIEAVEEAVLNSLFRAHTVVGRDDHVVPALPIDRVVELLKRYGRL